MTNNHFKINMKRALPVLLICLVAGIAAAILGFVNFRGAQYKIQTSTIGERVSFIEQTMERRGEDLNDREHVLSVFKYYYEESVIFDGIDINDAFVYDKASNRFYSLYETQADVDAIQNALIKEGYDDIVYDQQHLIPVSCGQSLTFILACPAADATFMDQFVLKKGIVIFLTGFAVIAAIIILKAGLSKKKSSGKVLSAVLSFIWVFLTCMTFFYYSIFYLSINYQANKQMVQLSLEKEVKLINHMPEAMLEEKLALKRLQMPEDYQKAADISGGNDRLIYINIILEDYRHLSKGIKSIEVTGEILNEAIPVSSRINMTPDYEYYFKYCLNYLLQALMISSFVVLLILEIYSVEEKKIWGEAAAVPIHPAVGDDAHIAPEKKKLFGRYDDVERMKLIQMYNKIGMAILATVSVVTLRNYVSAVFPDYSDIICGLLICIEACIGLFAGALVPQIFLRFNHSIKYLRFVLALSLAGIALCFFGSFFGLWMYTTGYLVTSLTSNITYVAMIIHAYGYEKREVSVKMIDRVTMGVRTAGPLGCVIASAAATLMDSRYIFVIAGFFIAIGLALTVGYTAEGLNYNVPDHIELNPLKKNTDTRWYYWLIMVPFNFTGYYMKYKVPIDLAAFGISVSLISYLYYVRDLVALLFKYKKKVKRQLKKLEVHLQAVVVNLAGAVALIMGACFQNFGIMLLVTVLIGFVRAHFLTTNHAKNAALQITDFDDSQGVQMMKTTAKEYSNMISPILVTVFGMIALPVVMIVSAAGYTGVHFKKIFKKPAD